MCYDVLATLSSIAIGAIIGGGLLFVLLCAYGTLLAREGAEIMDEWWIFSLGATLFGSTIGAVAGAVSAVLRIHRTR